ncbi:MAG: DNA polymerase III alpha subunit, partial [Planctomycetota bacterium]
VYETFGPTRTAMISTCGTFGLRSAFREAALAVGIAPAEFNRWSKRLPWSTPAPSTWREPPAELAHMAHNPVAQAFASLPECKHFPFDRFGGTLDAAALLLDVPRQMGLHPGGVVVAPHSITDHVACARAAKGPVVTQFDKDGVEAIGLVKMDLLGNRALTVLDDCLKILKSECDVEIDLETIPEDDVLTGELLAAGRAIGCFQIESPGMRNLLKQTAARTMDDVIQSIALIRPGPASSGMKDAYVRRFRGLEEATPPHPLLQDVLGETYGVMLYQEDVMQVAVALAGMTLGESDRLRRALSKRGGSELEILQARFMDGARQRGVETKDARHVWELIANFAAFGFCKAHAVTYGRISYRTAYLKAHFPVPFLAAFLASHTGYYAARVYVEEARRLGAAILGPDINRSGADYAFARLKGWPGLRAGLGQVRGLSEGTVAAILASRAADGPFLSLPDVIERTPAQRDEVEALIRTGALDAFDRTRPELLWRLHLLHGPARKAPRLGHGERPLDTMALESLGSSHGDRVAETVQAGRAGAAPASPGLFDGNTGWGGSGGRLPFAASQAHSNPPGPTAKAPGSKQPHLAASPSPPQQPDLAFPRRELGAAALPALPDPGAVERALAELELLGFSTSLHPVRLFGDPDLSTVTPCAELDALAGTRITLLGWVAASRRLRGADGQWMRFLTLEDESGLAEAALFATANARWSHLLTDHGPFLITGTVEEQMGACTLHVERVERVD